MGLFTCPVTPLYARVDVTCVLTVCPKIDEFCVLIDCNEVAVPESRIRLRASGV
jgi:hypothetical protein